MWAGLGTRPHTEHTEQTRTDATALSSQPSLQEMISHKSLDLIWLHTFNLLSSCRSQTKNAAFERLHERGVYSKEPPARFLVARPRVIRGPKDAIIWCAIVWEGRLHPARQLAIRTIQPCVQLRSEYVLPCYGKTQKLAEHRQQERSYAVWVVSTN